MRKLIAIFIIFGCFGLNAHAHNLPDVPYTTFKITQSKCNGLLYRSGSQLFIPNDALIHADGSICKHQIKLEYRELHNTIDIVLSKTSMTFSDKQGMHNLESAGMFDIKAECKIGKLEISKKSKIQVRFASQNNIDNLSAFIYDSQNSTWLKKDIDIQNFGVSDKSIDSEKLWGSPAPPPFSQFDDWDGDWSEEDEWGENFSNEYIEFEKKKTQIFKSMNIDEFGLYNYDRILKEDERIPILANFSIKNMLGKVDLVYVVYENINSVLYFSKYDWKKNFALLPNTPYSIFAISKDGRVAQLEEANKPKEISVLKDKAYNFILTLKGNPVKSRADLVATLKKL